MPVCTVSGRICHPKNGIRTRRADGRTGGHDDSPGCDHGAREAVVRVAHPVIEHRLAHRRKQRRRRGIGGDVAHLARRSVVGKEGHGEGWILTGPCCAM